MARASWRHWYGRAATVVLLVGGIASSASAPALAAGADADVSPPEFVSTGIAEGRVVPEWFGFPPLVIDDVGVVRVEAIVNGRNDVASCRLVNVVRVWCEAEFFQLPDDIDAVIVLRAYDAAGNHGEASTRVHVDNSPPTGTLSPATGSAMRSGPIQVTLTAVSDDTAKIVMSEGVAGREIATRTEAPWTFTWNAENGTALPCLKIFDRAGNWTTRCTDYIVDDQAPVIQRVVNKSDVADSVFDTGTGWVGARGTVHAEIDDESPLSRIEWWVDGALSATGTVFDWDTSTMPNPKANLEIRVTDAAGNSVRRSFTVSIDKAGPVGSVSPGDRALVRGSRFTTSVRASDPAGIGWSRLAGADGATLSGSYTTAKVKAGKDGLRTVTWVVTDKVGNETKLTRVVTVDNTAPTLKVTKAPRNGAKVKRKVTLAATAGDRNGVSRVELLVNGKVVAKDVAAAYRFTLNPKRYGKKFTVQLRAYDKAGNATVGRKLTYRR